MKTEPVVRPTIISSYDPGRHNIDLDKTVSRLDHEAHAKDLSTVVIIPSYDPERKSVAKIPLRVVMSWRSLIMPPNQRIVWMAADGLEVGDAYSRIIEAIINHPELSTWKYILTLEHDNMPPADGFIKLLERMEADKAHEFAAVGGLYFTKGEGGVAQIWGDPYSFPLNFRPQSPDVAGGLKECCGTGMGFTLFRMSMFKDEKLRKPWFKTTASREEGIHSQDLWFWEDARKNGGYRCAIDCSVKVGHYDSANDEVW